MFGPEIFLGFNFSPYSIIPVTWKLEYTTGNELELVSLEKMGLKHFCCYQRWQLEGIFEKILNQ